MKIYVFLALVLCAYAIDIKETKKAAEPPKEPSTKDKRQTQEEILSSFLQYRVPRKQEPVAPVEEPQDEDKPLSRSNAETYRPGQVISLNARELLELQQERKAPVSGNQLLQQLYVSPQSEHSKQNLQQVYYLEQGGHQVSRQPSSHAVIARPDYSSNGGEASVGAALSVSDTSAIARDAYNQELFSLLRPATLRQEEPLQSSYSQPQESQPSQILQQGPTIQSVAPQYQQVDRYITKPSKKSKLRNKVQAAPPQPPSAPQQYLIETTNVQPQQPQQQTQPQPSLYRQAPQIQRSAQALRYVTLPQPTQVSQQIFDHPESQGLKIVPAPQLQPQQPRTQPNYRVLSQYQPEAQAKQFRIVEAPRQSIRSQEQRVSSQSVDRPVTYLKRFPEYEKMRSVKIYEPVNTDALPPQSTQIIGDQQYYIRPVYRLNDQRQRFEIPAQLKSEQRELPKPPQSSIFVNRNLVPRKMVKPQLYNEQSIKIDQPIEPNYNQVKLEQHGQSLDERRALLPRPKNNKAYTPEEFAALIEAGYSVTPIPVSAANLNLAQSRSSVDSVTMNPRRFLRPLANRRHHYLPLRGDDAP